MRKLPGTRTPSARNRSSKQNGWLCGRKSAMRSASNETLEKLAASNKGCPEASAEIARRAKKRAKREAKGK